MIQSNLCQFLKNHTPTPYPWGIGVSGGPDSMALTFALANAIGPHNLVGLHVDHTLRANSTQEALIVKEWLEAKGITCVILTWKHGDIISGIQEKAREARYDLMALASHEHQIKDVFLAHHQDDQIETFFMRLKWGSGLRGLACMRPITYHHGLRWLRPLLNVPKSILIEEIGGHPFLQDPSNQSLAYERGRLRSKIDADPSIAQTIVRLQQVESYLESELQNLLNLYVIFSESNEAVIPLDVMQKLHPEMGQRLLIHCIQKIGGGGYPPRFDRLCTLYQQIMVGLLQGRTLGGTCIRRQRDQILIQKEG